jgi:hypothetical protein
VAIAFLALAAAGCSTTPTPATPAPTITTSPLAGFSSPATPPPGYFVETALYNVCITTDAMVTIVLNTGPAVPVQITFTVDVFSQTPTVSYGTLTTTGPAYVSPWMKAGTCFNLTMSAVDTVQPAFSFTATW